MIVTNTKRIDKFFHHFETKAVVVYTVSLLQHALAANSESFRLYSRCYLCISSAATSALSKH